MKINYNLNDDVLKKKKIERSHEEFDLIFIFLKQSVAKCYQRKKIKFGQNQYTREKEQTKQNIIWFFLVQINIKLNQRKPNWFGVVLNF